MTERDNYEAAKIKALEFSLEGGILIVQDQLRQITALTSDLTQARARIAELEKALEPFAHDAQFFEKASYSRPAWALYLTNAAISQRENYKVQHHHFDEARAVLAGKKEGGE